MDLENEYAPYLFSFPHRETANTDERTAKVFRQTVNGWSICCLFGLSCQHTAAAILAVG